MRARTDVSEKASRNFGRWEERVLRAAANVSLVFTPPRRSRRRRRSTGRGRAPSVLVGVQSNTGQGTSRWSGRAACCKRVAARTATVLVRRSAASCSRCTRADGKYVLSFRTVFAFEGSRRFVVVSFLPVV